MKNTQNIRKELNERKERSAWGRGVQAFALELLNNVDEWQETDDSIIIPDGRKDLEALLLNGASDWIDYSWGGERFNIRRRYRRTALHVVRIEKDEERTKTSEQPRRMA